MKVSIRDAKGFSLVELMVVVAIIGILAAIAVPNFQRFTAKSKQSEAKSSLSALYSAERAFQAEWGSYYGDFRNVGYQPTGQVRFRHGFSASFVGLVAGYSGAGVTTAGAAATDFSTAVGTVCGAALPCQEVTPASNGAALPAIPATAGSTSTFTAGAIGDVDGDATWDAWTVTERKVITNTTADIN